MFGRLSLFLVAWLAASVLLAGFGYLLGAAAATGGLISAGHAWGSPVAIFGDQLSRGHRVAVGLGPLMYDLPNLGVAVGIALAGLWAAKRAYKAPWQSWIRLAGPPRWGLLFTSLLAGLVLLAGASLFEGLLSADGFNPDDEWLKRGPGLATLAAIGWLLAYLLWASAEEVVFRGLIQRGLESGLRLRWLAALIGSLLFCAAHRDGSLSGLVSYLLVGLALAWVAVRSGGLELGIGLHAAYNTVSELMGDQAPDGPSGGPDWWAGNVQMVLAAAVSAAVMILVAEALVRLPRSSAAAGPGPSAPAAHPATPP